MSYYVSENIGNGHLRAGFKLLLRESATTNKAMMPCREFNSKIVGKLFCILLKVGLDRIYARYTHTTPINGKTIYWITTTYQSWLDKLVEADPVVCNNSFDFKDYYTFQNAADLRLAKNDMQKYMDYLFSTMKMID